MKPTFYDGWIKHLKKILIYEIISRCIINNIINEKNKSK